MEMKTKDFYSKHLITIPEWETAEAGLRLMKNNYIRHLPVTDAKTGEIIGIVSDRDLIAEIDKPEFFVRDLMNRNVVAFDLYTPLKRIVDEMIDKKVSSAMIKSQGQYCGIITSEDMLQVLSMLLGDAEEEDVIDLVPFFRMKYPNVLLA